MVITYHQVQNLSILEDAILLLTNTDMADQNSNWIDAINSKLNARVVQIISHLDLE